MNVKNLRQAGMLVCVSFWMMIAGESACATVDNTSVVVTSYTNADQADAPVTFGQIFVPGDVQDPNVLGARLADGTAIPLQVDVKATHGDGSLRHAVLTLSMPDMPGNSSSTVTLNSPGNNASGPAVTVQQLLATNFDTTVNLNVGGTNYSASARGLLQSTTPVTWLSGPLVSEWLVDGPVRTSGGAAHPHLTARFHVRAYAGLQSVRVSVTVENAWTFEQNPQNFGYDASVSVAGKGTVFSQTGVNHFRQARWRRVFWWGDDPSLDVAHDRDYLARSGAVPTYDTRLNIPNYILAEMESGWSGNRTRLMQTGLIYSAMPAGGGRPDIAPLPRWTARYLLTQDRRAKIPTLGTSEQAGSFSVHYRDRDTDLPVSIDTYPGITVTGSNPIFPSCGGNCSSPYDPDVAHQPSMSYVPYLVTGDYFHLEELQFWANWNTFYWGGHGGSDGLMVHDQVRAQAWGLRTVGHAAYITPDDHPLKAYFINKVNNNLNWYQANLVNKPVSPLGYMLSPPNIGADRIIATWMDDFFTWTVGHLANLGFSAAEPVFEYKSKFPVGRMVDPGFCFIFAGTYWTGSIDPDTDQPFPTWLDFKNNIIETWDQSYPSWDLPPNMSDAQIPALKAAECNSQQMSDILGTPRDAMLGASWSHEGYVSNLQPAVAISAERGVPNGPAAWQRFDTRAWQPDNGDYNYNLHPQWAIVPGEVASGNPNPGGEMPLLSLSGNPLSVQSGGNTTLSWATVNATSCQASGDWNGAKGISGSEQIGPLTEQSTFTLTCSNASGSVDSSVTVSIAAPGAPTVSLSSSANSVVRDSNVTLTWSAQNADACVASGAWTGNKGVSGSETVGPLAATSNFALTCSGPGGEVSESINVLVTEPPAGEGGGEAPSGSSGSFGIPGLLMLAGLLASRRRRGHTAREAGA